MNNPVMPNSLIVLTLIVGAQNSLAAEQAGNEAGTELISGRSPGDYVPSFHAKAVTGPLRNQSVCYVCRYGSRPVVMVFIRQTGPELRPLLRNIDRLVDQYRGFGLRSFGVLLHEDPSRGISDLQTFAFNSKVVMPLCVTTTEVATTASQQLHDQAAATVVFYREQRVVRRYSFRSNQLNTTNYRPVVEELRLLATGLVD